MKKGWLACLLILAVVVSGAGVFIKSELANGTSANPSLIIIQENKKLPDFSFSMANNKTFTNKNLMDRWTLLFIGYTFCLV